MYKFFRKIAPTDSYSPPNPRHLKLLSILVIFSTLAFVGVSWWVFTDRATEFDRGVEDSISTWNFKGLHFFFDLVTDGTVITLILLAVVFFLLVKRQIRLAGLVAISSLGGWLISLGLKFLFQRVRPGVELDDYIFSYPSGHATLGVCLFGALIFTINSIINLAWVKWLSNISLILVVLAIGLSRIYFGFHYPTDVLAGWLLGGDYFSLLLIGYQLLPKRITITLTI